MKSLYKFEKWDNTTSFLLEEAEDGQMHAIFDSTHRVEQVTLTPEERRAAAQALYPLAFETKPEVVKPDPTPPAPDMGVDRSEPPPGWFWEEDGSHRTGFVMQGNRQTLRAAWAIHDTLTAPMGGAPHVSDGDLLRRAREEAHDTEIIDEMGLELAMWRGEVARLQADVAAARDAGRIEGQAKAYEEATARAKAEPDDEHSPEASERAVGYEAGWADGRRAGLCEATQAALAQSAHQEPAMASDPKQVLDSIPTLLSQRNAQALVDLREQLDAEGGDKAVRKAVRTALHTLESRGVPIPKGSSRSWSAGDVQAALRGELPTRASVDVRSMPGSLRYVLSLPQARSGAWLFTGALAPDDRVLGFEVYEQTDGQRTRLERDWQQQHQGRSVPVEWLMARITWARARTVARGSSVPRSLDEALPRLGAEPRQRPTAEFLREPLAGQPGFEPAKIDELLVGAAVQSWPPLVDLDGVLQRAAELHGSEPPPTDDDARTALMRQALEGQHDLREGLGTIANAFEDTAVGLWTEGQAALARAAFDAAQELRASATPETLPWVPRMLGFQVASLLRVVQQQQQQQRRLPADALRQGA